MGRAGARRVRSHFTWSRVAEELETAYAAVLPRHPSLAVRRHGPARAPRGYAGREQRIASA
jgi:hypothetical protein